MDILYSILLVPAFVSYFIFKVIHFGIIANRKNHLVSGGNQVANSSIQGRIPDQEIRRSLDGLSLLTFGSIGCSYVTICWIVLTNTGTAWYWLLIASTLNFIFIILLRNLAMNVTPFLAGYINNLEHVILNPLKWISVLSELLNNLAHNLIKTLRFLSKSQNLDNISSSEIDSYFQSEGETLDEREVKMIRGVVRQDKTVVREIMVPRVDITAVDINTPIVELADIMVESGHSKIPVYKGELDQVSGFAYSMDLIGALKAGETANINLDSLLRSPLLIPESKTLEGVLREFQEKRVQLAVVVDEYGGVSGVVTIEDLLEEIVGEIEDEFDIEEPEIVNISEYTDKGDRLDLLIDARVSVDQLEELTGIVVEGEGFDTLGGFVLHLLGRLPNKGDVVEYDGISIQVISTSGRRLKRLRVNRNSV